MGNLNTKPKTDKVISDGTWMNIRYALGSMQGWRSYMEDYNCHNLNLKKPFENWSFFGIFDGHGGSQVSAICSNELIDYILGTDYFKSITDNNDLDESKLIESIKGAFLKLDISISESSQGTTVTAVFITPNYIIFINCGDSRSVLVRNSEVAFTTVDHKPTNPSEKDRIERAGGQVVVNRINGNLSVSRGLGDSLYKRDQDLNLSDQIISPVPDVTLIRRDPDHDQVILMASDGMWDVYNNEDLMKLAIQRLKCVYSLNMVAEDLLDAALYKGSKDNISLTILLFENAPKLDEQMESKDKELDETIINNATEYMCSQGSDLSLNGLLEHMKSQKFENLPPGGFFTKQKLIMKLFNKYVSSKSIASEQLLDHSIH